MVDTTTLLDNEPHDGEHPAEDAVWADTIPMKMLVDDRGRLAPFGDLAGLLGPRTLKASRLLQPSARAHAAFACIGARLGAFARAHSLALGCFVHA